MERLTDALIRAADETPNKIATIFEGRTRTFAELRDRVARLAAGLRSLGVEREDRVAILALNSDRYMEYLWALPWLGGLVNTVNIRWSAPEVAYSLADSGSKVLFVDDAFAAMVPALRESCPQLETVVYCGDGETPGDMVGHDDLIAANEPMGDAGRGGDDLVGVFYTGGTAGFPKGVMLSHRNLLASADGCIASGEMWRPGSVCLIAVPLFHVAGLAAWVGQGVLGGTNMVLRMFEPSAVLTTVEENKITDILLVPTMIEMVVNHPQARTADLSSLQRLMYGASSITDSLLRQTMELLPHVRMTQAYGMTECSPVITILLPDDHHGVYLRSAGRAAAHSQIKVIDPNGEEVPSGTVGEICIRGDHVTKGYWNKPDETRAAIHDGWLRSGDAGYVDENGYLFIVDRVKDMIVTGGENVYCAEVENVLVKHPAVATAAVIGLPDEHYIERVHAVIVLAPDADPVEVEELRDFARDHLAGYKLPRSIEFVPALPLSAAGKVLKRELRAERTEG